jgi:hypothetical protein
MVKEKKVKKITVGFIFSWIFGVLFSLSGIGLLTSNIFGGIIVIFLSLLITPIGNNILNNKFNFEISAGIKFLLVIIIFVVFGFSGTESDNYLSNSDIETNLESSQKVKNYNSENIIEDTQSKNQELSKEDEQEVKFFKLGDSIAVGEIEWKLTDYRTYTFIGDNPYLKKEADGIFLVIDVEVKNTGKSANYISDSYIKLVDSENREFSADSGASIYLGDNSIWMSQINPGVTKKGKVVFDVPKDVTEFDIKISKNFFEDNIYNIKLLI